jgi:hypothetical protein
MFNKTTIKSNNCLETTNLKNITMNKSVTILKKKACLLITLLFCILAYQTILAQSPGTSLGVASLPNLRDLGGYKTSDSSVVRRSVLYRSSQ